MHLYDPHDPYDPPEPYKTRYQAAPYDGEIAYTDAVVAKLLDGLRTRRLFDSSLIAVMADHGEAFGEHGENHHGIFLYDETIHVPLLIKAPGQHAAKKLKLRLGSWTSRPPSCGPPIYPFPLAMQGESLFGVISPESSQQPLTKPAIQMGNIRFIQKVATATFLLAGVNCSRGGPESIYTLKRRNASCTTNRRIRWRLHNLAQDPRPSQRQWRLKSRNFMGRQKGSAVERQNWTCSKSKFCTPSVTWARFRGLPAPQTMRAGADPKQKIGIANLLYQALVYMENEKYQEAAPVLEQVLEQEPNTTIALLQLGRAYMALKEYRRR